MRWLLLSAMLSLLIHGLLFTFRFDWMQEKRMLLPKTRTVAVALSYKIPDKPPDIQKIQPIRKPPVIQKPPLPKKTRKRLQPPVREKVVSEPVPPEPAQTTEPTESMPRADEPPVQEVVSKSLPGKDVSTAYMLKEATPLYKNNPPPAYPRIARRRGHQGIVVLEVLVGPAGKVKDLRVFQSSGYSSLDEAAKTSVANWLFVPGRQGNHPVAMWVKLPVRFQLQ